MLVSIIDYGSGNLRSAQKAFQRAARDNNINAEIVLQRDPDELIKSDRIVLPGVGAFADCRNGLVSISGMMDALVESVTQKAKPFLGICVGMQLMADRGLEKETTDGFGWIAGEVSTIKPANPDLKIPQIGWNTLEVMQPHPLLEGIKTGENGLHAYFVHSFHLECANTNECVAVTDYGGPVTAMVGRDNFAGTQFHPEKSQKLGLALIANFLRWDP